MKRRRPPLIVTVDGPAASGKSTAADQLAAALRIPFLSTGALYRSTALEAIRRKVAWSNVRELARIAIGLRVTFRRGPDGRTATWLRGRNVSAELAAPAIASAASRHAAGNRRVREAVVAWSRRFARKHGAVAEGRDCGTVIFPDARHKFFVTATPAERARRRAAEFRKAGIRLSLAAMARAIARRDRIDAARPWGALKPAPDAWIIDTTGDTVAGTTKVLLRMTGR